MQSFSLVEELQYISDTLMDFEESGLDNIPCIEDLIKREADVLLELTE